MSDRINYLKVDCPREPHHFFLELYSYYKSKLLIFYVDRINYLKVDCPREPHP